MLSEDTVFFWRTCTLMGRYSHLGPNHSPGPSISTLKKGFLWSISLLSKCGFGDWAQVFGHMHRFSLFHCILLEVNSSPQPSFRPEGSSYRTNLSTLTELLKLSSVSRWQRRALLLRVCQSKSSLSARDSHSRYPTSYNVVGTPCLHSL